MDKFNIEESFPLDLAVKSIQHYLTSKNYLPAPQEVPDPFKKRAGAFVTLKKRGELRGCIGTIAPMKGSLAEEIIYNAVSSALRDPRFPPVRLEELKELTVSVDVLEKPEPVRAIQELDPRVYGVIVHTEHKSGLLLPDLEGVETSEKQIDIARQKAGISRSEKYEIQKFKVIRYGKK
jgi:AmmeMemoRadiSam system protein A